MTPAEARYLKHQVDKALKVCAKAIDAVSDRYETHAEQRAAAMTILDQLAIMVIMSHCPNDPQSQEVAANLHANHVVMRLAQAAKGTTVQ